MSIALVSGKPKKYEVIAEYVRRHPGSTLREIADGIGEDIYVASGNIQHTMKKGLVSREGKPFRYYPMEGGVE